MGKEPTIINCHGHDDEIKHVAVIVGHGLDVRAAVELLQSRGKVGELQNAVEGTNEAMLQLAEAAKSATFEIKALPRIEECKLIGHVPSKPTKRQKALQVRRGARHW